jgi:acyl-CoA hydrolase
VVECSPYFARTIPLEGSAHEISVDDIDVLVASDEHPTVLASEVVTEQDLAIAQFAATFVREGALLQTGIGAVPSLVAQALAKGEGGDYGVHSEMFTDGLYELFAAGKISNSRKAVHPGVSGTTFAP